MAKREKSFAEVEAELTRIQKELEAKRAELAAMEKERNAVLGRLVWEEMERDPDSAFSELVRVLPKKLTLKKERVFFDTMPLPESSGKSGNGSAKAKSNGTQTPHSDTRPGPLEPAQNSKAPDWNTLSGKTA